MDLTHFQMKFLSKISIVFIMMDTQFTKSQLEFAKRNFINNNPQKNVVSIIYLERQFTHNFVFLISILF